MKISAFFSNVMYVLISTFSFCLNSLYPGFCFNISHVLKILFSEPVGSVSPKVNSVNKFDSIFVESNHSATLICPAQSYPVPVFR